MFKDTFKTETDALEIAKKEDLFADADKTLSEIVGVFHEMDKMINGLDKKLDEEGENRAFGNFFTGLKNMFTEIGSTESSSFMKNLNKVVQENDTTDIHKEGEVQIKTDSLRSMFKGGDTNSNFNINRVGDGGEAVEISTL